MKKEFIHYEIVDTNIAIVSIHKPPVNALNSETYGELYEVFHEISLNDSIYVVILKSEIDKYFVAGADVKEFVDFNSHTGYFYSNRNNLIREYIRKYNKPIICAINGIAFGGGLALSLICDIRIASEEAMFNLGEINMGIIGATQYIAKIAHLGTACKMVYSGEPIDAETALRVGLVDEIVPPEKLMPRCMDLGSKIAKKSPVALQAAKKCMIESQNSLLDSGLKYEENLLSQLWGTEDKNEAVKSFLEKREPHFIGK
jgi:enoyl-CoA hydratase/carnithine racemase